MRGGSYQSWLLERATLIYNTLQPEIVPLVFGESKWQKATLLGSLLSVTHFLCQ